MLRQIKGLAADAAKISSGRNGERALLWNFMAAVADHIFLELFEDLPQPEILSIELT